MANIDEVALSALLETSSCSIVQHAVVGHGSRLGTVFWLRRGGGGCRGRAKKMLTDYCTHGFQVLCISEAALLKAFSGLRRTARTQHGLQRLPHWFPNRSGIFGEPPIVSVSTSNFQTHRIGLCDDVNHAQLDKRSRRSCVVAWTRGGNSGALVNSSILAWTHGRYSSILVKSKNYLTTR